MRRKKIRILPGQENRPISNIDIERKMPPDVPFSGVFQRDDLPKTILPGHAIVVNLDPSGGGTHWVCVCRHEKVEYFDSFGLPPPVSVMSLMKKINPRKFGCSYNTSQIQPINSAKCGYYCMKYIVDRHRGREPYDIIYGFSQISDPLFGGSDELIEI